MHDDIYLWETINIVLPKATETEKQSIYIKLYNTMWTINKIEELYYGY